MKSYKIYVENEIWLASTYPKKNNQTPFFTKNEQKVSIFSSAINLAKLLIFGSINHFLNQIFSMRITL